jgi:hypothetical protein
MNLFHRGHGLRRTAVVALISAGALMAASPAMSASPHQVDPTTMTPALNPNFAPWSCFEAGTGITCQGDWEHSYHETAGFSCGGQDVWVAGGGREHMTRWHTSDGLATKTLVALNYPADVFALTEDGSGTTVTVRGHWQRHYTYPVPGDLSARVMTEIGAIYLVTASGSGNVLHDTGRVTFAPGKDFDEIAEMKGVHEYYSDPAAFEQLVCDQLT